MFWTAYLRFAQALIGQMTPTGNRSKPASSCGS
jgi:hypothetical protein